MSAQNDFLVIILCSFIFVTFPHMATTFTFSAIFFKWMTWLKWNGKSTQNNRSCTKIGKKRATKWRKNRARVIIICIRKFCSYSTCANVQHSDFTHAFKVLQKRFLSHHTLFIYFCDFFTHGNNLCFFSDFFLDEWYD